MNKEELFAKIEKASRESRNAQMSAREKEIKRVLALAEEVRSHTSEVKELCELINHAIENGYLIQCHDSFISKEKTTDAPRLQSDGIAHKFGFIGRDRCICMGINFGARFHAVGECGGGCVADTFMLDDCGNITFGGKPISQFDPDARYPFTPNHIWAGCEYRLNNFLSKFDSFKLEVMHFIENIDTYKCYRRR